MYVSPLPSVSTLLPSIRERAPDIERARRLPADLAAQLADAGAFAMLVPKAIDGLECSPATTLATIAAIAEADAATAWCIMIGATSALPAAYLDRAVARDIFRPGAITAGVFAPMGRATDEGDAFRLSGRWAWGSGSANAQWFSGAAIIIVDGKPKLTASGAPEHRSMFVPASDIQLHDTWHVAGLEGSGSGDVEITNARVLKSRTVSLTTDKPWADGPVYRFPLFGLLALGIAAVALGNARGAIEDLVALATAKTPQGARKTRSERGQVQATLADAEAKLSSARAFVDVTVSDAFERASRGDDLDVDTRARLRLAATHATRTAADVVRAMYDLGGGSSVFASSPLQRRFRDAHVATQHMMIAPPTYELAGRVRLGLPVDVSVL